MRHTALPTEVIDVIHAMPHDSHPMGVLMTGICALSAMHPEAVSDSSPGGMWRGRRWLGGGDGHVGSCLRAVAIGS